MINTSAYSGANWLRSDMGITLSPLGERVANLLGWVFEGLYHLDRGALLKANWSDNVYIRLAPWCSGWSTYDSSILTRLVVACHDLAIRMEINPCNFHHLELLFHPRKREESLVWGWHPTVEWQIDRFRREAGRG